MALQTGTEIFNEKSKLKEQCEEIRNQYPHVNWPDPAKEPLFYGRLSKSEIQGRHAIVNHKTGDVFGLCSDDYALLRHEKVVYDIQNVVAEFQEYGNPEISIKLMDDGAKMVMTVKFPEAESTIVRKDKVVPLIKSKNSYDLKWQRHDQFGANQLICTNGLTAFKVNAALKKRHMNGLLDPEMFKSMLNVGMTQISEQLGIWQKWAETSLELPLFEEVTEKLFSPAEREKILSLRLMEREEPLQALITRNEATIWDAHSALTQFLTHEVRSELRKEEDPDEVSRLFHLKFPTA